jgi:D-alanyl-D-alanine dipeptidase
MASNAFAAHLRWCEGTVMHRSTHAALALVLLAAQPVQAQAPLPPGFVDAAAVVDGLIVDMRYFGANNFVGERIDGYERRAAYCRNRRRTR